MDEAADLREAAHQHVRRFNDAVHAGTWAEFAARFTEDATMRFTNVPVGPFAGRAAISSGYEQQPPDDTMTIVSVEELDAGAVRVAFTWDTGGAGSMVLRWRDGLVSELAITFAR